MIDKPAPETLQKDDEPTQEDPLTPVWSRRNWVHEEAMHLAREAEVAKRRRMPALKIG